MPKRKLQSTRRRVENDHCNKKRQAPWVTLGLGWGLGLLLQRQDTLGPHRFKLVGTTHIT